jgi:type I restriction enzyme S subunit
LATGATQRAITDKSLLSLEVPVPDLEKQRIAVKALDLAEGLRENCKKQIFLILELRTSLLMKQLAKQPLSSNALKNIIDVDDRINYGVVQPGNSVPNGVPMIRITDLSWERIDRSNLKSISKEIEKSYERSRIRGNEILMTCVGNIGTIALVSEEDIGSNIARAVNRIPITNERLRVFVAAYLSSPIAQAYFQREARTVAQATLNIDQLKEISIPIYPPDDLDSFHGWSSRVGSLIELARVEEQKLLQLVSSIQNKVFK